MHKFVIPGFPDSGPEIDLPDIAEMLVQPMYWKIDAQELRKRGTDFQKRLLDLAPLSHQRKNVNVSIKVNLFYPGRGFDDAGGFLGRDRLWHRDGHMDLYKARGDIHHLLLSHCQVLTEFNTLTSVIETEESMGVLEMLDRVNSEGFPVDGRSILPNRFVTFTDHLHRPIDTRATHHQFRYSYRIIESDENPATDWPRCLQLSQALLPHDTDDHRAYRKNIGRGCGFVLLHLPDDTHAELYAPHAKD
jgi:hypothetical protein